MHGRGAVVGGNADDLRAVVTSLGQEVKVRNLRVGGVGPPAENQIREKVIVGRSLEYDLAEGLGGAAVAIADLGVHVEGRRVEQDAQACLARDLRTD